MATRMLPDVGTGIPYIGCPLDEVAKTADYTLTQKDNSKRFTNKGATGAVNFTLPALAASQPYVVEFAVRADQSLTVTSAEGDNIEAPNDLQADSVGFATSGDKVGGRMRIETSGDGTAWMCSKMCSNALTIVS